jgi:sulfur carrier protein ThiS
MKITLTRDDLEDEKNLEIETEAETVRELLDERGIQSQEVLVSRDGTIITGEHELEDGDDLRIFDVIAGG